MNEDINILGHHFLEASAGTGKTFAIEHLFVRHLLEEGSIALDNILVVTFTKKAAAELKVRIRKNVEKVLAELKRGDGFYFAHLTKYPLKDSIRKLEEVLLLFERAQIFTIHSFCYQMLREHAFEAKFYFEEKLFSDVKQEIVDFLLYGLEQVDPQDIFLLCKKTRGIEGLLDLFLNFCGKVREDNSEDRIKGIFFRLLNEVKGHITRTMQAKELLSYDSLLEKMLSSLKGSSFRKKIQDRYKVIIVDEFQDTDPFQWQILKKVAKNKNLLSFYLIGDPKQSIYGFRRADVYTYLEASSFFKKKSSLDVNFRSSPRLVQALNAFFSKKFAKDWLELPSRQASLSYLEVRAGKEEEEIQDGKNPLCFFVAEEGSRAKRWPTFKVQRDNLFPYIAKEILRLRDEFKFGYSQFAILVKDRYQKEKIREYLSFLKIPVNAKDIIPTLALQSLKEVMRAALYPSDLNYVRQALLGPYIELPPQLVKERRDICKFSELGETLRKKGLAVFFNEFLNSSWQGLKVIHRLLKREDLSFYSQTLSSVEILLELDKERSSYKDPLFLFSQVEKSEAEGSFSDEEGVVVTTIHSAKGMEYDIVFTLGLACRVSLQKSSFLLSSNELKEQDAEKLRQFYVALTRAKKRAYIPITLDKSRAKKAPLGEAAPVELFFSFVLGDKKLEKESLIYSLQDLIQEGYATLEFTKKEEVRPSVRAAKLVPPPQGQILFPASFSYSFSSLSLAGDREKIEVEESPSLPIGKEMGILFHRIMERIIKERTTDYMSIVKEVIQFSSLEGKEREICELVEKAFHVTLRGREEAFCLKDVDPRFIKAEVEFFYPFFSSHIRGFIDLIFCHKGKYYIIDWKTNFLQGPCLKKIMARNDYYLQAEIYKRALLSQLKRENNFGGIFYIFVRALLEDQKRQGVFYLYPKENLKNIVDVREKIIFR